MASAGKVSEGECESGDVFLRRSALGELDSLLIGYSSNLILVWLFLVMLRLQNCCAGSMLGSSMSMDALPNLPGVRRDPSSLNPKLYREFKASRQASVESLDGMVDSRAETPAVEVENSLASYFENPERFGEFNKSLNFYPSQGKAYNDTSGRYSLRSQQADRLAHSRSLPYCSLDNAPPFVVNDKRTLRFYAYFEEEAPENLLETKRARLVEIDVGLADNAIQITEPAVLNSGLSQGKILKKHQVPKPLPNGYTERGGPLASGEIKETPIYTINDFYAGAGVNIYNRVYYIYDANEVTKQYFASIGKPFGDGRPRSALYWDPKLRPGNLRPKKVSHKTIKNLGFYEYERKVLRFFGCWDGSEQLFGDEQNVRVHYSLADNKIEVLPINVRNSGRDKLSTLLKRTVIMKKADSGDDLDFPASYSRATTASGTVSRPSSTLSFNDKGKPVLEPDRSYHWKDFYIGMQLAVASLFILITDADDFTREFYASKSVNLGPKISMPEPTYPKLTTYIPPYNPLYGSEEDSLQTCKGSLAGGGPVHKDGAKAKLFAGMTMKFLCTLENPKPADETRRFMLTVYLEDDTVAIMEPEQRNSGHKGGTFLSRGKINMPDPNNKGETRPFMPEDVTVGAPLQIRSHRFLVHDADEFTYRFLEENPERFPLSDAKLVKAKVQGSVDKVRTIILSTPGLASKTVTHDDLQRIMQKAGVDLFKQEVVVVLRHLDPRRKNQVRMTQVLKFLTS